MKLIKSRLVIAAICILLAALGLFLYSRGVQKANETINVVTVTAPIQKGEIITASSLTIKKVGRLNLPENIVNTPETITGKYALTDFMPDSFILTSQVSDTLPNQEKKLLSLDGTRVAVSISLKTFSDGLSDKIVSGDIVSCIVTAPISEQETTFIPASLTYVEVLATTTGSGKDKQNPEDKMEENLATVTLLVTPAQAITLTEYDNNGSIRLALVHRGDSQVAASYLSAQDAVLNDTAPIQVQEGGNINEPTTGSDGEQR